MKTGTRPGRGRLGGAARRVASTRVWLGRCVHVLVLAVVVVMSGGCQTADQPRKPPSLAFMWKYRQKFDLALARGDAAGAKAALDKLWTRRVKDELRSEQLEQALLIQRLFAEGGRQIEAEDFDAAEETWTALGQARDKIRENWTVVWTGVGYPDWMDRELASYRGRLDVARDRFAERVRRRFDESLLAKHWGEAERSIADLGRVGMPSGAMEERLAVAKAVEVAGTAYAGHFKKGEFAAAEEELVTLERLGADTAAHRQEWREAYLADCEKHFSAALSSRDYAGAETLFDTFDHLGADIPALSGRVKAKQIEDARDDFESALAKGLADDAEGHLGVLEDLGEATGEGMERIRILRLSQQKAEFDQVLKARDYEGAEGFKPVFEGLGEDFGKYAERIRLERVAEIREGLPTAWEQRDVREVREACDKLSSLGDDIGDEQSHLGEMFDDELREAVAAMRKAADGVWKPDFGTAEATDKAFRKRWNGVYNGDTGPLDETLRVSRKKYELRGQSTEGPLLNGCPEYWLRCSPELLLDEDPESCIDGLLVHLAGVAENVRQTPKGAFYQLVGLYGRMVEVEVEDGGRLPLSRQWIYLMATIQRTDGGVVLHEIRHAALGLPRKPMEAKYAQFLDDGGYDFMLENCFREFGHAPEGKQLEALDHYGWLGGKRTKAEEFAGR